MDENKIDIFVDRNIPNDVVIFISPLTCEEVMSCNSLKDIFKLLKEKKKMIVLKNIKPVINNSFDYFN